MASPLLDIRGLSTWFDTEEGVVKAVDGVDLDVATGETVGVVGESGCGKSVTALSILRLIPTPPGRYAAGRVLFDGRDLLALEERKLRAVRGNEVAMVFQEPMTSLNPVYTVGSQIGEVLRLHRGMGGRAARARSVELLRKVGLSSPEAQVDAYPHQMSGGMKQRVMIAMAIACEPALLVADEPTTALDVTIQAQILDLLRAMQRELGMAILLITHDLGVVAEMADRVVVMYAGRVVESAPTAALFAAPRHHYTDGLLRSLPEMHRAGERRLREIPGTVPHPLRLPSGCRFRTRCPAATSRCAEVDPPLEGTADGRRLACHHPVNSHAVRD